MRICRSVILLLLLVPCAHAQTVDVDPVARLELWPRASDLYLHKADLGASARLTYRSWELGVYMRGTLWGGAPTKWDDTRPIPLVAEWLRVIERRQGAYLQHQAGTVAVGVQLSRRAVHHVWRHDITQQRHDYFPIGGGWRDAGASCPEDAAEWTDGCRPSLGYWERVGPRLEVRAGAWRVLAVGYAWTWKEETTLPPQWGRVRLTWQGEAWRASAEVSVGARLQAYGTARVARAVGPVEVGIAGGRVDAPDWSSDVWRVGLTVGQ